MNLIVNAGHSGAWLNWGAGARRAAIGPGRPRNLPPAG